MMNEDALRSAGIFRDQVETLVLTEIVRRLYKVIHTGEADPEAMDMAKTLLIPALQNHPEALKELHLYPYDTLNVRQSW